MSWATHAEFKQPFVFVPLAGDINGSFHVGDAPLVSAPSDMPPTISIWAWTCREESQ
jgi:hypothetical protein